jgi:anti-sigma regulatory factor (Ser/Thr protein kinase)
MKIHLPNSAFLGNIDPFLASFDPADPETLEISSNPRWLSLHPVVLAMVAALGLKVPSERIHFEKLEAVSRHYLVRMGLFQMLGLPPPLEITEHEAAGRFVPLARITNSEELKRVIADIIPLLHLTPPQAEPIKYILSELVRNVFEHACAAQGAILCAQFYDKSNTIRIGIADAGVGIRRTISAAHPVTSELEAIGLALRPGVTGTTNRIGGSEYNAGAGLFFIKSIARMSRDFFMIYSGSALFKLLKSKPDAKRVRLHGDPFADRHSKRDDMPYWQGTVVGIDIALEPKQGFSFLLDQIRQTYVSAIQEQKKRRHKKARFL